MRCPEQAPLILPAPYYGAAVANLVLLGVIVVAAGILFLVVLVSLAKKRWTRIGANTGCPLSKARATSTS
jgi:hypothetical protein